MRIFLLPISTRRSLLYCERIPRDPAAPKSYVDRITSKANEIWASWERKDSGWQKQIVVYGNKVLRRIPFEEWGLKTLPPLTDKRKQLWQDGKSKVQVLFPALFLQEKRVPPILRQLATERQSLHRRKMWWSIVAMPITAPFALIPIIPNIPFFYLAFRAYSHWKALSGSKHLEFLLSHNAFVPQPSTELNEGYAVGLIHRTRAESRLSPAPTRENVEEVARLIQHQTNGGTEDVMLLQGWNGKLLAERFKLPEMEAEVERAVEQVEASIKAREELMEEKREIEKHTRKTWIDVDKARQSEAIEQKQKKRV